MKRILLFLAFVVPMVASSATNSIPWRVPNYSLTARSMDVRQAFDTFGVAEGIPVIMSEVVRGTFSGAFKDMPAAEFLDRLATVNNLTWYYDGAAIYVTGAGEMLSTLIDLRYMKAGEVRAMLGELGVEDARFPIKTASDDELIMVSGPPRYVTLVAEMIDKADKLREQRTFAEVETRLFPLRHTWADDVSFRVTTGESQVQIHGVARLLEEIMLAGGASRTQEGTNDVAGAGSKAQESADAGFRAVIRPENRLNAVLVRDVATRMPMYEKLIRELDTPQKLVEIGVTIVEMSKNDALDWQLSIKATAADGRWSGGAGQNAGNLFDEASLAGKGLAGAVSYLGKHVDVMASLDAVRSKGKMRSISRTSLVTLNNLAAELSDEQSYHARMVGEKVASLESVTAGTRLQLRPRVLPASTTNAANQVWVSMILSDGGFESVTVDAMPMDRNSTLTTQAAIYEDESILLAGYLRDVDEDAGWGIPYLRDIPFIGWIFGGKSTVKQTVQRLFILTPHVIDIDQGDLARDQTVRLRDITEADGLREAAEINDDERKLRDLEYEERREKREDELKGRIDRRKAEIEDVRGHRELDARKRDDALKTDKEAWRLMLDREVERYEQERKKAK